jgi:hypothetical protein
MEEKKIEEGTVRGIEKIYLRFLWISVNAKLFLVENERC